MPISAVRRIDHAYEVVDAFVASSSTADLGYVNGRNHLRVFLPREVRVLEGPRLARRFPSTSFWAAPAQACGIAFRGEQPARRELVRRLL